MGGLVRRIDECDSGRNHFPSPLHGSGIVSGNLAARLQEGLHQKERWRFANIVGSPLESQPEHTQVLAAESPECALHLSEKALALLFVDAHDFIEQAKGVAALAGHGAKGHNVLGKAGSAITAPRIQESAPNAGVGSNAVHDLIYIGSDRLADRCDRVYKGYLHGEEGVGRVLD